MFEICVCKAAECRVVIAIIAPWPAHNQTSLGHPPRLFPTRASSLIFSFSPSTLVHLLIPSLLFLPPFPPFPLDLPAPPIMSSEKPNVLIFGGSSSQLTLIMAPNGQNHYWNNTHPLLDSPLLPNQVA